MTEKHRVDYWASPITSFLRAQNVSDWIPNAIVDIGANDGQWSQSIRQHFPTTKLLLIEASNRHIQQLGKIVKEMGNAEYKIALITDRDGDKVTFFGGGDTGNSIYREKSATFATDKPIPRITQTLDHAIHESFLKNQIIDIIKADVQGAELLVLKGGTRTLSQATFVFFEASIVEYNEGGSCLFDVDKFLRSHGFFMYDLGGFNLSPAFRTDGVGQFDVVYVKPTSSRLPKMLKQMNPTFCGQGQPITDLEQGSTSSNPREILVFLLGLFVGVLFTKLLPPPKARTKLLHKQTV